MWEMRPPAPMHSTLLFENTAWSKPAIFCWRSSAPATALPRSLIEVSETVDAGRMFFGSFSIDFDFQIVVQPHEAYKAISAKDSHHSHVPRGLEALLKALVSARRMRSVSAGAGVTVEVRQQSML